MKYILKLAFLGIVVFLIMNYSGRLTPEGKKKTDAALTQDQRSGNVANVVNTTTSREREGDPVISKENQVRTMNNNPSSGPSQVRRERTLERTANTEWIKEATQKHSPDSWHLLMQYDILPETVEASATEGGIISSWKAAGTFYYLRGRTRIDMLATMETNVHEIAHHYYDQYLYRFAGENKLEINHKDASGYIYISPSSGFFISFPLESLFPSAELAEYIPEELRTYRFDTYINGNTSTQSEGVIGLLNELHAYYLGSKYCFEMLEGYKEAAGSHPAGFFEWVTHTQSTMSAFYEFDFYILEYLLLMKNKYNAGYESLRSYQAFTDAYGRIRTLYKELIDRYLDHIEQEARLLHSSGLAEVKSEKGWIWIKPQNSNISSGTPVFSDPREKLMPVIESRKFRKIKNDFKLTN